MWANNMPWLIAEATKAVGNEELKGHYGNLIFMGCFFIALLIAFIWWLRR